jgi:hypothetical protein
MDRMLNGALGAPNLPVLARAAAGLMLKANAVRYDAVASTPFTLDLMALRSQGSHYARLVDMIADTLSGLDLDDIMPATVFDADLARSLCTRLRLPKAGRSGDRVLVVAWAARHLGDQTGFALFDDRLDDQAGQTPPYCLTRWATVLEVMHMNDYGDRRARFALAAALRDHAQAV